MHIIDVLVLRVNSIIYFSSCIIIVIIVGGSVTTFLTSYKREKGIKITNTGVLLCFISIQFIDGEPVYKGSCRTNIGGYHITDYLKQLLSLKYPHHM